MKPVKVKSEFIQELHKIILANKKYNFGTVTAGNCTLSVTRNGKIFNEIVNLCSSSMTWKRVIVTGNRAIVIDSDILLNRKMMNIFGTIPPTAQFVTTGIKLTVS